MKLLFKKPRYKIGRLILHIGSEKTGTTAIQRTFSRNRVCLERNGVFYPRSLGNTNHLDLSAHCLDDDKITPVRRSFGLFDAGDVKSFRKKVEYKLAAELDGRSEPIVVLSSEQLSSNVTSLGELHRLKKWLSTISDNIEVLLYVRRQDKMILSSYSTEIKAGGTHTFDPCGQDLSSIRYDFKKLTDLWSKVFPNIDVRVYEKKYLKDGDIVSDFLNYLGGSVNNLNIESINTNGSLTTKTAELLRLANKYLPPVGEDGWLRGNLQDILSEIEVGKRIRLSSEESKYIMDHFSSSNKYLYEKSLKDRYLENPLCGYLKQDEEVLNDDHLDLDDFAKIFSQVWLAKQKQFLKEKNKS